MTAKKYYYALFIVGLLAVGFFIARKKMNNQKASAWLTYINGIITSKKIGYFKAKDKLGTPISLEWTMTNVQDPEFSALMKSLSDITIQAFTPVEVEFLKAYTDQESQNDYCKAFEPLFKNGLMAENWRLFKEGLKVADWSLVEEKMQTILQAIQLMDYSSFGIKDVHCFVIAKDTVSQKILGYITFYITPDFSYGEVKATGIGVLPAEQNRGLGRLLMSSVFKIFPTVKRLFLSTRPTNKKALKAYKNWGFVPDLNPIKESWGPVNTKQWVYLEYQAEQIDILQKTVGSLVEP